MKIAIDISQIAYEGTGVARFTRGLIREILRNKDHEWVFFFSSLRNSLDPHLALDIKKRGRLLAYRIPPALLSILWNDLHFPKFDKFSGIVDWVITSDWTEPPAGARKATIVHDVAFLRYPETVHPTIRSTHKKRLLWVKRESSIIFADSQATKNDLVALSGFEEKKIIINYPGVAMMKPSKDTVEKTGKKFLIRGPFILTVGKIEPRKNMNRLIEAFADLGVEDCELIIVGPSGWGSFKTGRNVRFLGFVTDAELGALYSLCTGFVYPSLWEGFGYPVLEAMSYGAPVATSKSSSLGEIAGDAALLFDPLNTDEIKKSLHTLLSSEKVRRELSEKGKKQAVKFTWEKYYKKMMATLEK